MNQITADDLQFQISKIQTFNTLLFSKDFKDFELFRTDATSAVAQHGIKIAEGKEAEYNSFVQNTLSKYAVENHSDLQALNNTGGCVACELGLGAAFGVILILTVIAVAAAIAVFAPEVAASVAVAFLESAVAVKIVLGIVLVGAEVLAVIVCTKLIKCKK